MGKGARVHNIYASEEEWRIICKVKEKTGISVSRLLMEGFQDWFKRNPKKFKRMAKEFKNSRARREAIESERKTGDFLGSFDKFEEKIKRINREYRRGNITQKTRDFLKSKTERNYDLTRTVDSKTIMKSHRMKAKGSVKKVPDRKRTSIRKRRNIIKLDENLVRLIVGVMKAKGTRRAKVYAMGMDEENPDYGKVHYEEALKRKQRSRLS